MLLQKTNNLEKLDNVSKRLKYIIDTMGVKQSHMAEKLGLSPSGLHYILNNDVKFSKNAKKIAEYLNINEDWLLSGKGEIYEENNSIKTYKIPVYYPDQLKLYYKTQDSQKTNTDAFMLTTATYSGRVIGIYITEPAFAPKFEIGDMVAFEQSEDFNDGEILLVYIAKTNNIMLKYGFHVGKDIVLLSINDQPKKLSLENGDRIIGGYRECHKKIMIKI